MDQRSILLAALAVAAGQGCAQPVEGPVLLVFNAAALGPPFRALGDSLRGSMPGLEFRQENAPSLEAIRKLTSLGRVPDVLATADVALFDAMIVPAHSGWYLIFGTNALVLAYGPHSRGREDLSAGTWWQVLLRPGMRTGRSDPSIDPSGYRTLMALQLAERHYGQPGLAAQLLDAMSARYVRHAEADLSALIQAGELDYIWTYRNLARAHGLDFLELPPELNLADPSRGAWYEQATARVARGGPGDSLTLHGAPILFALTVPDSAPHPDQARAFVSLLLSPIGRALLLGTGFEPLDPGRLVGRPSRSWEIYFQGLSVSVPGSRADTSAR